MMLTNSKPPKAARCQALAITKQIMNESKTTDNKLLSDT